jgi:DNA-binding XRE family transcriptional regulator
MLTIDVSTLSLVEKKQTFGERLALYREKAGLSRQQLADGLKISRAAIALLENGDSKSMAPDNLLRAAEILGIDPMVLQFGEDGARREYGKRAAGSGVGVSEPGVKRPSQTRDVPIIGYAIATPDLDGFFDDQSYPVGHGEGYIEASAFLPTQVGSWAPFAISCTRIGPA